MKYKCEICKKSFDLSYVSEYIDDIEATETKYICKPCNDNSGFLASMFGSEVANMFRDKGDN